MPSAARFRLYNKISAWAGAGLGLGLVGYSTVGESSR